MTSTDIVSIVAHRQHCGVTRYAERLERQLGQHGRNILKVDAISESMPILEDSDYLVHVEVGQDLKRTYLLKYLLIAALAKRRRLRLFFVLHSVFERGQLDRAAWFEELALYAQRKFFRFLAKRSTLLVLSREAYAALRRAHISARFVPFGIYVEGGASIAKTVDHSNAIVFGIVGHPYRSKRYDLAVRAMLDIPQWAQKKAVLRFVGGDPRVDREHWEALRAMLVDAPMKVEYTGPLSEGEYTKSLQGIDVGLLPYAQRSSGSAVVADLLGAGSALIVSEATVFDAVVAAGAAERVQWAAGAAELISDIIVHRERLAKAQEASVEYARLNSIAVTAREILDVMKRA